MYLYRLSINPEIKNRSALAGFSAHGLIDMRLYPRTSPKYFATVEHRPPLKMLPSRAIRCSIQHTGIGRRRIEAASARQVCICECLCDSLTNSIGIVFYHSTWQHSRKLKSARARWLRNFIASNIFKDTRGGVRCHCCTICFLDLMAIPSCSHASRESNSCTNTSYYPYNSRSSFQLLYCIITNLYNPIITTLRRGSG